MNQKAAFAVSLSLNLALVGAAVCMLKKTVPPAPSPVTAAVSVATNTLFAQPATAFSNSPAPVTFVTNQFAWSDIEAEAFEALARNLRAIGCPEKTVRDIVIARAQRALQGIHSEADRSLPFWASGSRRAHAQREVERERTALREKILAQVEHAIGRDFFLGDSHPRDEFEEQAIMRFALGPMPDEAFFQVSASLDRFHERRKEIDSRTQGVWLDEDEAELAQLREQHVRELRALLTPAQFEEMTARVAMMSEMDEVKFEATDLTTAEVRQLGLIRARFTDPLFSEDSLKGKSLTEEQEQELTAAERAFLGEARFSKLERAADDDFKTLFALGRENQLPRAAAEKVFDLRKVTAQEVQQLRQDRSLSDADRRERIVQIQTDAQQAVANVLGATATGQYLGRGGAWLTNATGL